MAARLAKRLNKWTLAFLEEIIEVDSGGEEEDEVEVDQEALLEDGDALSRLRETHLSHDNEKVFHESLISM